MGNEKKLRQKIRETPIEKQQIVQNLILCEILRELENIRRKIQ